MAFIEEIHLDTALQLLNALKPWGTEFETRNYIFRGHPDTNYQLLPSALRDHGSALWRDRTTAPDEIARRRQSEVFQVMGEYAVLADFYKLADRRGLFVPTADRLRKEFAIDVSVAALYDRAMPTWIPDDLFEVAALAQHYGVPTSLLDWSYDPLTAAYFASQSIPPDKDGKQPSSSFCVWALNRSKLAICERAMQWPLRFVTPHYAGNPNIYAQAGVFTLWQRQLLPPDVWLGQLMMSEIGKPPECMVRADRRTLDEQMGGAFTTYFQSQRGGDELYLDGMFNVFKKFVVPSTEKEKLKALLRRSDLGPSRIFPGYGGCAKEVMEERLYQLRLNPAVDGSSDNGLLKMPEGED